MDADELIASLIRDEDRVPLHVIEECARGGAAMIDGLDRVVGPAADWGACASDGHWWLRLHAAFILGLMDDAEAGQLLVHLMRRLAADEDENLADWLAGYWPALFRNKPEQVLPEVEALAWADHAQPWFRGHVFEVLLAAAARRGPEELDACLARVAEWIAVGSDDPEERALIANLLLDFPRASHRTLLDDLAAKQKGKFGLFDQGDVENAYAGGDKPGWLRFDDPWVFYSPAQIESRQTRWAEEAARRSRNDDPPFLLEPHERNAPKIGRNDPCPCGSGKKYKKCCLRADGTL